MPQNTNGIVPRKDMVAINNQLESIILGTTRRIHIPEDDM